MTESELMRALITGRSEAYIKRADGYNPYKKALLYDWEFRLHLGSLLYTDSYRGFNPYGGVEYLFENGRGLPLWSADYAGYACAGSGTTAESAYHFLKEARGRHLSSCGGNLFSRFDDQSGLFTYQVRFEGNAASLSQTEDIYYNGKLALHQLTAGRLTAV